MTPQPAAVATRPGRRQRLVRATALAAALGLPFAVLAFVVRAQVTPVLAVDEAVIRAATDVTRADPALRRALVLWQDVLRPGWVNATVALVCLWAWRRHGMRTRATWAFVTVLVAWGLQALAKLVVQRARPVVEDAVAHAPGYSFPSGHAANTASAGTVLVILLWPLLRTRGRAALCAGVGLVVVLTALDRVYLGVHYPSDVVAGVLFGTGVAGASYAGYRGSTSATARGPDAGG